VVRNRLRRQLRAAVAELADEFPSGIYAVTPSPEAVTFSYDELRACVAGTLTTLRANIEREGRP